MAMAIVLANTGSIRCKRISIYLIAISAGLICACISLMRMNFQNQSGFTIVKHRSVEAFTGYLVEDGAVSIDGKTILKVSLTSVTSNGGSIMGQARGRVLILVNGVDSFSRGQHVFVRSNLQQNKSPSPEMYIAYIERSDIRTGNFVKKRFEIRYLIKKRIEKRIDAIGYPACELFRALFLGIRETLSNRIVTGFRNVGSSHILALSGLHVGILFVIVTMLLYPLPWQVIKVMCGTFIILCYLLLVGPKPSLIRASIMIILSGAAFLLDRDFKTLNILALSAFFMLLIDPFSAFSLSFQLSFLALTGILTIGRLISFYIAPYIPGFLRYPLSFSLGAQLSTLPISLFHFGFFYPLGFVATLLLTPLVTVFLWTGLLFLFITPMHSNTCDNAIGWLMDALYRGILFVTELLSRIPYITTRSGNIALSVFLGISLLLLAYFLPVKKRSLTKSVRYSP